MNAVETKSTGRLIIAKARRDRMGYLTEAEVEEIANDPETRLTMLLVRCGSGRFLAPAQDVGHFIAIIETHGATPANDPNRDYIRDVSLPAQGATR